MTKDDLLKFCTPGKVRLYPHSDGVNTYCSNGILAIRVAEAIKGAYTCLPNESPIPAMLEKHTDGHGNYEYVSLPFIPRPKNCRHCNGTGIRHDCTECNGVVIFPPDEDDEFCSKCGGTGMASNTADSIEVNCRCCDGTGEMPNHAVRMPNGQWMARRYLALIATLPNVTVSTRPVPDDSQYHALHFIFDGGEAICMPLNP
ncbi:hypothetical protein [Aquitalea magnusonii]|uniref:Uncharacterized protein n=1 Tax=Aquitalea magnusonii TaxID=332411 RepID=A0A318JMS3_9NEIS|nr:hypothetical protein [Aquitalea magnusonii]PXX49022.1 hypothetical protein DFR38_10558 [Aquitalea magnusonii]